MLLDIGAHLLIAPAGNVGAVKIFNQIVRPVARFTFAAVHKRVRKTAQMAACNPCLRVHENGGIQAHVIFVFLNKFFTPGVFDIVFKLHAERAEIPCVGKAAVDFGAGVNEAPAFAQRNQCFKRFFCVLHYLFSLSNIVIQYYNIIVGKNIQ